ncbi:MAG TPA: hypothetical protein VL086_11315 [Candidatus Nitrosotalea sp.]|nr:hypothetical protein [Candidatus Nitrosotalea sp.]
MDPITHLKGRMAEALVEGIFKRAQYTVARVGRETQMPALMRSGRGEFMPDFVVWRTLDEPSLGHHSYRLLAIQVKYRADLDEYLRHDSPSRSPEVAQQWPELYEIIVTDRPEAGRSCFQAVHVSALPQGLPPVTLDLHLVPGLDVYRRTVEEYEGLVREIFPILGSRNGSAPLGVPDRSRKPAARMHGRRDDGRDQRRPRPAGDPRGYRPSAPPQEHRHGVSE